MSGEMLKWALWNARQGFRVFPLKPGDKTPAHKGWQQEATTDEAAIRRTWNGADYNVGVATGSGLVVVDIDVKNGKSGEETFAGLGLPEGTFAVGTPSGGRHLYYRGPDVRNSVQSLGPGVDVRGVGGYVVGAGSVLGERQYAVGNRSPLLELQDALGGSVARDRAVATPAVVLDTPEAADRALAYLKTDAPLAVEGSGGDHLTYKVACTLKDFGVSEYMAWELMVEHWNDRCSPPWTEEALETKVRNAYAYGVNPPGIEDPKVSFEQVHIEPPERPGRKWFYHGEAPNLNETWLFHGLLPATGLAVIVGPTQSAKTFMILEMLRCLATGKPFFGIEPETTGASLCLFAGSEGSGFAHRMAALQEPNPLPIAYTSVHGLRERKGLDKLLDDLREQKAFMQAHYGVPLRVVVLETLSASGLLANENDNAEAAQALSNLAQIGQQLGVLMLTSHHPPKHGQGSRGADAIPSNSDYVLEIVRKGRERIREVELTKARNAEQRKIGAFSLVEVEIGRDHKDRPVISMAISMGEKPPAAERSVNHQALIVECIEHALLAPESWIDRSGDHDFVSKRDVQDYWRERSRITDGGNRSRAMSKALEAAEQMGVVESRLIKGKTFYRVREIET